MVKKAVGLMVVLGILSCAAIGKFCLWRRLCRDLSVHQNERTELRAQTPVEPLVQLAPTKKLAKSPRSGQIYWGWGSTNGVPYKCAYRVQAPKRIPATSEQSNLVAKAFSSILESYEGQDIIRMKTAMKSVPEIVTNMYERDFRHLEIPLCTALSENFTGVQTPKTFTDIEDFDTYLRSNIDLVIFLGNIALKRTEPAIRYDDLVLEQLMRYAKTYHEEGNEQFAACADKFMGEWFEQIESENGFTRQYMWLQVDLQWPNYNEGRWSLEQLSAWAKQYAKPLIRLGYTPKWLSEFDDLSEAVK